MEDFLRWSVSPLNALRNIAWRIVNSLGMANCYVAHHKHHIAYEHGWGCSKCGREHDEYGYYIGHSSALTLEERKVVISKLNR
jgi:hypothetical protein